MTRDIRQNAILNFLVQTARNSPVQVSAKIGRGKIDFTMMSIQSGIAGMLEMNSTPQKSSISFQMELFPFNKTTKNRVLWIMI